MIEEQLRHVLEDNKRLADQFKKGIDNMRWLMFLAIFIAVLNVVMLLYILGWL